VRRTPAKLIFMCGKMAAGKSTLARELAEREAAILLVQDDLLERLYPGAITDVTGFVQHSARLREALTPHIMSLLSNGISVVLDFPGNTRAQRAWFRHLIDGANAAHELHFVDASDGLCRRQLRERSRALAAGTAWTTDAEFEAITARFQAPAADEGFNVVHHERG
jgi:predicted kinase